MYVHAHVHVCVSATTLLVADCWCLKCQAGMEISGLSSCHVEAGQHSSAISQSVDQQQERDQSSKQQSVLYSSPQNAEKLLGI